MEDLQETRVGAVVTLALNRPQVANALSAQLNAALVVALQRLDGDPAVGAIVLTGNGKAFCSGGDVSAMQGGEPASLAEREVAMMVKHQLPLAVRACSKIVIAAINGAAAGAGMALALAADFRLMQRGAILACGFGKLGLSGDFGITSTLTRLAGPAVAKELLILSPRIEADEAQRLGLVNRVWDAAEFADEVAGFAHHIAAGPQQAWAQIKRNVELAETATFGDMIQAEVHHQARLTITADHREAVAAFREKRLPAFTGN